jgi:tetratricopeptide (TPR) repeat protein
MSKFVKWILLGIIVINSGCAYYNTLFNAKREYNEGIKFLQENPDKTKPSPQANQRFEKTIEKCWKLIDIYSDKSKYADDALLYICKSEFYLQKYPSAKQHLEQFMRKYADSPLLSEAHLWYGKVLLQENDIDGANEYFRLVINNSKDGKIRSQASFELGKYALQQKNYEQAVAYLEKALKEDLDDEYKAEVLFSLAEAYFQQGEYKKAISYYEKVEKQNPTLDIEFQAFMQHARALTAQKKFDKALTLLRKMTTAQRFNPFLTQIKSEIGIVYEKMNDYLAALDAYSETLAERKNDVGSARAAFRMAKLYERELSNLDSAVFYYRKTIQLSNKFDSLEVAKRKDKFLSEYKTILDKIKEEEYLVRRLTTEPSFMDSLYKAQFEDSFRVANGLSEEDTVAIDSLIALSQLDSAAVDSLNRLAGGLPDESNNQFTNKKDDNKPNDPFSKDDEEKPGGANFPQNPNKQFGKPSKPKKKLEKRKLPEIEFDLMNHRYQLAEFYLLKEENYDSAAYHFEKFIETYEDSILTPKALYSLIFIYGTKKRDPQKLYRYEKELLANYIDSPFAIEIMKKKGMLEKEAKEDSEKEKAYQQFLEAESLLFAGKYQPAIERYQKVANLDTTWEISAKAQFAIAWAYEKNLNDTQKALLAYQRLANKYPTAKDYVAFARKKISEPVETPVAADTTMLADNTANQQNGNGDTTFDDTADENKAKIAHVGEDLFKAKIRWRNRRESR